MMMMMQIYFGQNMVLKDGFGDGITKTIEIGDSVFVLGKLSSPTEAATWKNKKMCILYIVQVYPRTPSFIRALVYIISTDNQTQTFKLYHYEKPINIG